MSFKPEVRTSGNDPKFYDNALRFATYEEALASARDLANRWMLVVDFRATESPDPVNYEIKDGVMRAVAPAEAPKENTA